MTHSLLKTVSLRKSFGGLTVTDGVSLDVMAGELHAIIGPNGAGKTTLIHQLSGSMRSDFGKISLNGRDITHLRMAERVQAGIARSYQITSILEDFSVLENAAIAVQARSGSSFRFFGTAARESTLNSKAMRALSSVGLASQANRRAGSLSHGEKRQLEIAIALATNANLLLLDEPLAGTGPEEASALVTLLGTLKGHRTILMIEHDMQAVFSLADRISVLVFGRIVATGTPAEIRENAVVKAAYLGEGEAASC